VINNNNNDDDDDDDDWIHHINPTSAHVNTTNEAVLTEP
jgi:hypothetical protein